MKPGVVVFPGSSCDQGLVDAISAGIEQEVIKQWHKGQEQD